MNRRIVFVIAGILILVCYILCRPGGGGSGGHSRRETADRPRTLNEPAESGSSLARTNRQAATAGVEPALVPCKEGIDPDQIISAPHPDFVWYTQPTSKGAIMNSKGETIFQATDELPFVSMRSRAGVSQVVIFSVNRHAFVVDLETKQKVALPGQPPLDGAKGFENWELVDDATLLGEYHVPEESGRGESHGGGHEDRISESKLYVFNIPSGKLAEVSLPAQLQGTPFSIGRMANGAMIEIVAISNHLAEGESLGWFNLTVDK